MGRLFVCFKRDVGMFRRAEDDPKHHHCPNGCEKPQPFRDGNRLLCDRCLHEGRGEVVCVPCTPNVCD